jgi:hypothetical protein
MKMDDILFTFLPLPVAPDPFSDPSFLFWGFLISKSAISFHRYDNDYPMFLGIA